MKGLVCEGKNTNVQYYRPPPQTTIKTLYVFVLAMCLDALPEDFS